jgi:hypothetical protein
MMSALLTEGKSGGLDGQVSAPASRISLEASI